MTTPQEFPSHYDPMKCPHCQEQEFKSQPHPTGVIGYGSKEFPIEMVINCPVVGWWKESDQSTLINLPEETEAEAE